MVTIPFSVVIDIIFRTPKPEIKDENVVSCCGGSCGSVGKAFCHEPAQQV